MAEQRVFGKTPNGEDVVQATIQRGGSTAWFLSWGARLQEFRVVGLPHSLVLGAPDLAPYFGPMIYFGCIVGRVANRIQSGRAVLDGQELTLETNENGRTMLHGGSDGTAARNWRLADHDEASCTFALRLEDGQGGFPGNIDFMARYSLDGDGALWLEISAQSDAPTFCNPAHHSYWNLDGAADTGGHRLLVAADQYLPVDAALIPLGQTEEVAGSRFDFRQPRTITAPDEPTLDHNFCLRGTGPDLHPACSLQAGGVTLDIDTTAPGLQVFDGTGLDTAPYAGLAGSPYGSRAGTAIEPQLWPDAPNQPDFPSIVLRPGETFRQTSRFRLTVSAAP